MKKLTLFTIFVSALIAFSLLTAEAQFTINIPKIPKVKKPKTDAPTGTGSNADNTGSETPDDVRTNKHAPASYDANLKIGDLAIAHGDAYTLEPVRIVGRSGNAYKVSPVKYPDNTVWFNVNSVYPYFDPKAFEDIRYNVAGGEGLIAPFLECYAKKSNLELDQVEGPSTSYANYYSVEELKRDLQAKMPKLAAVDAALKSRLQARPNTFDDLTENPAIWDDIASNREEYMRCAVANKESRRLQDNPALKLFLQEIEDTRKEIDEYNPQEKLYLVGTKTYNFLLLGVSPKAREKWYQEKKLSEFKENFDPGLNAIAVSAAKKLPSYLPNVKAYAIRNPAEERLMKSTINDLADHKIFHIGIKEPNWLIEKNDLGIPKARYKHGMVWVRYVPNDHPYCRAYYINIVQDYAGGGTYGASYGNFVADELVGCPAGK